MARPDQEKKRATGRDLAKWYFKHDGKEFGPLPVAALKEAQMAGFLLASDEVWDADGEVQAHGSDIEVLEREDFVAASAARKQARLAEAAGPAPEIGAGEFACPYCSAAVKIPAAPTTRCPRCQAALCVPTTPAEEVWRAHAPNQPARSFHSRRELRAWLHRHFHDSLTVRILVRPPQTDKWVDARIVPDLDYFRAADEAGNEEPFACLADLFERLGRKDMPQVLSVHGESQGCWKKADEFIAMRDQMVPLRPRDAEAMGADLAPPAPPVVASKAATPPAPAPAPPAPAPAPPAPAPAPTPAAPAPAPPAAETDSPAPATPGRPRIAKPRAVWKPRTWALIITAVVIVVGLIWFVLCHTGRP